MSAGAAPLPPFVRVLPAEDWAETVAEALVQRLRVNARLRVCLPTGDTPSPVYSLLAARDLAGDGLWAQATVVLLDEWADLPPGDRARCDVRLRRELLDHLAPPPRFVPIDVDGSDDEEAAREHDAAARGLDLALLGLGMNGHVGFNEPGSRPDDPTRLVRLARSSREAARARYGASRTPTGGITVGMDRLLEAGEVWLLVTGERKASILRRALLDPEGPDCPASYLRRHPRLTVFTDEAAASLV
ncbi:MAG TPA: 6-phosphogluconolactonase [Candidatus Limnocylindrales bacterium]|nr:6-phosphogluconolactonase [Candidatus Limnocylindrales bacterium]